MTTQSDFKLCYIKGDWAWFTTQDVDKQWGDDWDDAPYDCNAGDPYAWRESDKEPKWELLKVAFISRLNVTGSQIFNSRYCVQDFNRLTIPWLISDAWDDEHDRERIKIMAGCTLPDFIARIQGCGGDVYMKVLQAEAVMA